MKVNIDCPQPITAVKFLLPRIGCKSGDLGGIPKRTLTAHLRAINSKSNGESRLMECESRHSCLIFEGHLNNNCLRLPPW